jgi:hypothetical protein
MLGILKEVAARVGDASRSRKLAKVRDRGGAEGRCDCTTRRRGRTVQRMLGAPFVITGK